MHCQLDQVREILDIAAVAEAAVKKECPESPGAFQMGRMAGPIIYGLLLLKDYDAFMQAGMVNLDGQKREHCWVEVYFEGEAFVLDAGIAGEILFLPGDEAGAAYGYEQGRELEWSPEDYDRKIWRAALDILGINKEVEDIWGEIDGLFE